MRISDWSSDVFSSDLGIPLNEDYCDGSQSGVYRIFSTQKNGQRCSAARAYLEPARQRANLSVVTHAHVDKIMIEASRAIGVAARISGEKRIFRTRCAVLLCPGTLLSPPMLMRPATGPCAELAAHGLAVQARSDDHTSELQYLMRPSPADF